MTDKIVTFEKAMTGAEKIAATLSSGTCTLDEALRLYEEGVGLLAAAGAELARIEKRAQELIVQSDGKFDLVDVASSMQSPVG